MFNILFKSIDNKSQEKKKLSLRKIFRENTSLPMATKRAQEVSRVRPKCVGLSLPNTRVKQVENDDFWGIICIMRKKKRT